MKVFFPAFAVITASLLVGCAKKEEPKPVAVANPNPATASTPAQSGASGATTAPAAASPATAPSAAPAGAAATSAARTITVDANDQMKFSVTRIDAKPGEDLKVVLKNVGSMPKEAMGHNWVLLKAGTDAQAFATTAAAARDTEYIPASLKDQIIVHTPLIGPKQTAEVTFKAPTEPGEYVFLCTFPAHYIVGMKGVLAVK